MQPLFYNSMQQLAMSVDSLRTAIVNADSTHTTEYILAGTAVFSAVMSIVFYKLNKNYDRNQADDKYIAVWGAVMTELRHALERMRYQATDYLEKKGKLNVNSIELIDELRAAFLKESRHPKVSEQIIPLYLNIIHFRDSYKDAVNFVRFSGGRMPVMDAMDFSRKKADLVANAIWIAQNRHCGMTIVFDECREQFHAFVKTSKNYKNLTIESVTPLAEKHRLKEDDGTALHC